MTQPVWQATASDVDVLISDSHGRPRTVVTYANAADMAVMKAQAAWRDSFGEPQSLTITVEQLPPASSAA